MSVFDTRQTIHRGDDGEIFKSHRTAPGDVKVFRKDTDDAKEVPHVKVPVSSTTRDRDGDNFAEEGVDHMLEQLQSGEVPVFLDHGVSPETGFQDYRALEAIGGWVDGEKDGDTLYGIAALDPDKEQSKELVSTLENGVVPMGWSVGFRPTEKSERDDGDGYVFEQADLLEVSAVGIPSNPDAVSASIVATAKGFGERRGVSLDPDELSKGLDGVFERAAEKGEKRDVVRTLEAIEAYRDATDEDERELRDFVEWAHESDFDGVAVSNAVERYVDAAEELDEDPGIKGWLEEQRDALDDGGEKGDGDEDDEEDEDDDGKAPSPDVVTLSDDTLERFAELNARHVRDAVDDAFEELDFDAGAESDGKEGDGDDEDDDEDDDGDKDGSSAGSVKDRPPAREPRGFGSAPDAADDSEKDTDPTESDSDEPSNGLVFGRDLSQ